MITNQVIALRPEATEWAAAIADNRGKPGPAEPSRAANARQHATSGRFRHRNDLDRPDEPLRR
jgi:hypothetical protein